MAMLAHIKELTLSELQHVLAGWKFPAFHARQIMSWIYEKQAEDFSQMSSLPAELRRRLKDSYCLSAIRLEEEARSYDGTEKFLFSLADRLLIEAVSIPADKRVTGCISSQAGCRYGCAFCASGSAGFKRNLTVGEILDEVVFLRGRAQAGQLTHLVFMGMGEPLDNYDRVIKAIRIINADYGPHIGARRITVSTCGIIPGIRRLATEGLQIELSVSLHAADDTVRSRLMPVNKRYPLAQVMDACREYVRLTNRQVTFEYVLIKGLNSSLADARKLGTIVKGLECKINLIPLNAVLPGGLEPPNKLDVLFFRDALMKNKVRVTVRRSRGRDIEAACGQLRMRYEKQNHAD